MIECCVSCKQRLLVKQNTYRVVSVFDDLVPSNLADDLLPTPVAGHAAKDPEKKDGMLGEQRKLETVVEEDSC